MTNRQEGPAGNGRRGLHRDVVEQLGLQIVQGDLKPGHVLVESDLGVRLGVSRTVVREAIKVLAAKGLVQSRPRVGTRVLARDHWRLLDTDVLGWQLAGRPQGEFFRHLFEVRALLEPGAARLAAARRDDADAAGIEALVDQMDDVLDDPERYIVVDLALHSAILSASRNELLAQMADTIANALRATRTITTRVPGGPRSAQPCHRAVVTAISEHDAAGAEAAMKDVVATAARDLELVLARDGAASIHAAEQEARATPGHEAIGRTARSARSPKPRAPSALVRAAAPASRGGARDDRIA